MPSKRFLTEINGARQKQLYITYHLSILVTAKPDATKTWMAVSINAVIRALNLIITPLDVVSRI